jgi:hypothetical protein
MTPSRYTSPVETRWARTAQPSQAISTVPTQGTSSWFSSIPVRCGVELTCTLVSWLPQLHQ